MNKYIIILFVILALQSKKAHTNFQVINKTGKEITFSIVYEPQERWLKLLPKSNKLKSYTLKTNEEKEIPLSDSSFKYFDVRYNDGKYTQISFQNECAKRFLEAKKVFPTFTIKHDDETGNPIFEGPKNEEEFDQARQKLQRKPLIEQALPQLPKGVTNIIGEYV